MVISSQGNKFLEIMEVLGDYTEDQYIHLASHNVIVIEEKKKLPFNNVQYFKAFSQIIFVKILHIRYKI